MKESCVITKSPEKKGLTILTAAFFIVVEMGGSGVLAIPKAVVDTTWVGIILIAVLCMNAGYSGTRLGVCWAMIEERHLELKDAVRNPYSCIALEAKGIWASRLVSVCMQITLFGVGTVYLLITSQTLQGLLKEYFPDVTFCTWILVIAAFLTPAMWFGSPKEFWIIGVTALGTNTISCILILAQTLLDMSAYNEVPHANPSFERFFVGFGAILFAFGGAATFPTIQNDMRERKKFPISVVIGFSVILVLYVTVATGGYLAFGDKVESNILMSLTPGPMVTAANIAIFTHLLKAFLILTNPLSQELEEILKVPKSFNWKRIVLRTCLMLLMIFIGETIPKFGKILSLVGGSTVTLLTFVFPPFFYMALCDQTQEDSKPRTIPLYNRIYLWLLIVVGLLGGAASTYSAVKDIVAPGSFTEPCYC